MSDAIPPTRPRVGIRQDLKMFWARAILKNVLGEWASQSLPHLRAQSVGGERIKNAPGDREGQTLYHSLAQSDGGGSNLKCSGRLGESGNRPTHSPTGCAGVILKNVLVEWACQTRGHQLARSAGGSGYLECFGRVGESDTPPTNRPLFGRG